MAIGGTATFANDSKQYPIFQSSIGYGGYDIPKIDGDPIRVLLNQFGATNDDVVRVGKDNKPDGAGNYGVAKIVKEIFGYIFHSGFDSGITYYPGTATIRVRSLSPYRVNGMGKPGFRVCGQTMTFEVTFRMQNTIITPW